MEKSKELDQANKAIETLQNAIKYHQGIIQEIKTEIEAKKPDLKHGRCGVSNLGTPYITIGNGKEAVIHFENGESLDCGRRQKGKASSEATACFEAFDLIRETYKRIPPKPLIGSKVIVYCRYLFAVPVTGIVTDISSHDGSYCVIFAKSNHGSPNVLKRSGTYFLPQQCEVIR